MERLQKYLARSGIASRRKCEELIKSGLVKVNGRVVDRLGTVIDPVAEQVEVGGRLIKPEKKVYILLYKPRGYVTTLHEPQGRPKVTDLIKNVPQRVYPVGRLDYDSEGLLLLTNDGELTHALTHPRHHIPKTYLVWVNGIPSAKKLDRMAKGLLLEDGPTLPAKVTLKKITKNNVLLEITICEGRKRQIRRMCKNIGHPVYRLKRVGFGPLNLKGLKPGEYRYLTRNEIKKLKKSFGKVYIILKKKH